jgi:hypothetical protein
MDRDKSDSEAFLLELLVNALLSRAEWEIIQYSWIDILSKLHNTCDLHTTVTRSFLNLRGCLNLEAYVLLD